ncbi:endothelin-converting enzyme-like 1 isoform X2 [Dermacentor albipictus]|uniref:endothelin-converting enzyme-like 1 isoform X2 n=1 Tax=Dermacentor albipictus TaxID=60249 RepID=UPI0038FCDA29
MPPRRPSVKPGLPPGMPTGSRRSSRSSSRSSSDSSRSSQKKSPHSRRGSTTEQPPAVERSAADAAETVDAVASDPAPLPPDWIPPDAAPAPTAATSEAAARVTQVRPTTRRLSMLIEPTHRFAFDGTKPTREETKTSEFRTRDEVKYTTGERLSATNVLCQMRCVLKMALVAGLLIAVVIALVLLVLSRLYWSGFERTTSHPFPVCRTGDCAAHAVTLSSSIASALDPCQDFSLFVCTSWNRAHAPVAMSLTEQLVADSLLALTRMTAGSGGHVTLEDRPALFMALCKTARPDQDSQGVQALNEFLRDEVNFIGRITEHYATYALLLEALAVLSGKWLVPLWFRLDLIVTGRNSSVLVVEPEPLVTFWNKLHASLNRTYSAYVEQFIEVVYGNDTGSPLVPVSYLHFLRDRSEAVQGKVLRVLSLAESTRLPIPVDGKLADLPDFAPKFTSAAWTEAVSEAYGRSIGKDHAVRVDSRQLLDAMNHLSGTASAEELLYHAVWWFVQQIGALTSNALFETTRVALGESGDLYQGLLCGAQATVMQSVEDTLNMVQSVAVTTARVSRHLGQMARDSTYSMLLESHPAVWPTPPTFEPADFERLYGEHADDGSRGFFGHWRSSRVGIQRSFGRGVHSAAAQFYKLDPSSLTAYSRALKAVSVATAALQPPLYYGAGTAAMRFGGLGFAYAAQLVRNMDVGALLDAAAARESHVAEEKDHLLESFDCSDASEKRRAFPHLPALVLAHAAYSKSTNGSTKDPRLTGLEQYTGTQVFFMTACLGLCEEDASGRHWSSECNAAARNYAPFAEAFHCSTDTPMNPKEKCRLLKS